jgi:signal transduction histidine kinase/ActR/RegA family two-component response regulator
MTLSTNLRSSTSPPGFLQGGGAMGALMRSHDWAATPLGPPEAWPQALRTAIRLILNTGHPMYVWWGPELICFYNDAYSQSIGPERHPTSLGQPGRAVWSEIWNIIGPQIDQVMSGGGATWQENALIPITRNGLREDVYWTYSFGPIDDEDAPNGIGGVLVVCTETTEQVLAAQRADQERERFAELFEQAPTFMARLTGPDHRFELVNPSYMELIGDLDVVGRTVLEALPEVAAQGFIELLDDVYRTGEPYTGAGFPFMSTARPNGLSDVRYLDFVYQPMRDATGAVSGIFVVGVDVTDRTHAEMQLREQAERLQGFNATLEAAIAAALAEQKVLGDVLESTDAFIQVSDLDYRFLAINRASADEFDRIFGVRPKVGDGMLELLADRPKDQAEVKAVWARALSGEEFVEIGEFGDSGRERRFYEMKFNTLRDRSGAVIGAFQFVYDVTDRLRDQARLAEAESQLRQAQKIEAIGQLTGGVAHDFNNLLMVILGGLSMIDRPGDPARRTRILEGMRQAAERGASLSRQLLAFARRQPLKPEPVDLRAQLAAMQELLDRALRGDVHVTTDFSEDLWAVLIDPSELELVLLNLCVNARDAMPEGGTITIAARNAPNLDVDDLHGDFVVLSVRDDGAGMPPEVLSRVFEPFFTTKEIGKGSGLGLPQVYGFAEQSGGAVKVESQPGQGTTVTLTLPRTDRSPQPATTSVDLDRHASKAEGAILLVEDDDEVASLVTDMLRELGYGVTRAASAEAALGALADRRTLDLVFSDIMMPGPMNGLDLAREAQRRRPGLPILLTSGYADAAMREAARDGFPVLKKPYDIQALERTIAEVLDAREPANHQEHTTRAGA